MSNLYKEFKEGKGNRDQIFQFLLSQFEGKPVKVLEIGATRDKNGRAGDGWSTFFWAEHIKQNGGHLTVCDVAPDSIQNCREIIGDFLPSSQITYYLGTGLKCIETTPIQEFDIVLLDGSDDPMEMLNEYEAIKNRTTFVLCDDFSTKGSVIRNAYPHFMLFKWHGYGHELALYTKETIYLPNILN